MCGIQAEGRDQFGRAAAFAKAVAAVHELEGSGLTCGKNSCHKFSQTSCHSVFFGNHGATSLSYRG